MLKIRDDIDLKELEKYGFEYNEYTKNYENNKCDMWIQTQRTLDISTYLEMLDLDMYQELLYDLIKDDLVEKVED